MIPMMFSLSSSETRACSHPSERRGGVCHLRLIYLFLSRSGVVSFLCNGSTVYHIGITSSFRSNDTYSIRIEETIRTAQEEEPDSYQELSRATTTHSPG